MLHERDYSLPDTAVITWVVKCKYSGVHCTVFLLLCQSINNLWQSDTHSLCRLLCCRVLHTCNHVHGCMCASAKDHADNHLYLHTKDSAQV